MTAGLRVEGLRTGYVSVPVLDDVTLQVEPGQMVAILGANGAGKTTLLRCLAGILPTWEGAIQLDGAALTQAKPWNRVRAGMVHVPEGRHVFTAMSVEDNLRVAHLVAPKEATVGLDEVYALFPRLAERQRQAAGSMSGGEQQMLAIARALVTNARIVIIDELSNGLAPVVAQQLVRALVEITKRGVGVLLVEQSPQLLTGVEAHVHLLERGRLVNEGTLASLGGPAAIAAMYLGVGGASSPTPGGSGAGESARRAAPSNPSRPAG